MRWSQRIRAWSALAALAAVALMPLPTAWAQEPPALAAITDSAEKARVKALIEAAKKEGALSWIGVQIEPGHADPIIAGWGPWVLVSLGGGFVLLISALLFVRNLLVLHRGPALAMPRPLYALAVHPPQRVPAALNGFALWNVLVLVLMLAAYGYPIAQFLIEPSPTAIVHRVQ